MKSLLTSQTARTSDKAGAQFPAIQFRNLSHLVLYQARLIYSWAYPVLLLVVIGITLLLIRQYQPDARYLFYGILEIFFPLATGFLFVPLILKEQQQRTLILIGVTRYSLPFLFIVRLMLVALFLITLVVTLGLLLHLSPPIPADWIFPPDAALGRDLAVWPANLMGGPDGIVAILLTLLAPTFLLGGSGTMLAHLTADTRSGYLAIFTVWMLNRTINVTLNAHPLLHNFYLFVRFEGTGDWLLPKLTQLSTGVGFFVLAWLLIHKLERLLRAS